MTEMTWFRFYSEALTDRKLQRVCITTGQPKATVIGVWTIMLSIANDSPERGKLLIAEDTPITVGEIMHEAGLSDDSIIEAFKSIGIIEEGDGAIAIVNWDKRQFTSDNSTERVRKHRAGKKQAKQKTPPPPASEPPETTPKSTQPEKQPCNVSVTPPESESYTESDSDLNRGESLGVAPAHEAPPKNDSPSPGPTTLKVLEICKQDYQFVSETKKLKAQLVSTMRLLGKKQASADDVTAFEKWRTVHHWTRGSPPTLAQVGEFWGEFEHWIKAGKPEKGTDDNAKHSRGNGTGSAGRRAVTAITNAEARAEVANL